MKNFLLLTFILACLFEISFGQIKYTQPILTPISLSEKQFNGADLNKDSIIDIVTYSDLEGENYLKFYQGNADGTFTLKDSVLYYCSASYALQPNRMQISDFDNDGNKDVAFLCGYNSLDSIHIMKGSSNFNFIKSADIPGPSTYFPPWLQCADIDNDGFLDLAFANSVNNDDINFILNNGNFVFQPSINFNGQGNSKNALFDFINQDTLIDLVTVNYPNSTLNIFYNDGLNSFTLDTSIIINIGGIPTISVSDFDNNNRKDFVIYESNNFVTTLVMQKNAGEFVLSTMQTDPNIGLFTDRFKTITSDINKDNLIDLAICQNVDSLQVYLGDGTGLFIPYPNKFNGFGGYGYEGGKINQENSIDFVSLTPGALSNSLRSILSLPNNFESVNLSPRSSGNCGITSITFFGIGIQPKMHLKFTTTGQLDIEVPDSNITYTGTHTFKVIVNFSSASIGKYNVVLTDSNGIATTIVDGFEVQQSFTANPSIQIIGPNKTRPSQNTRYYLKITNNSNCTMFGFPLFVFVSSNVNISFPETIYNSDMNITITPFETLLNNYFDNSNKSYKVITLLGSELLPNQPYYFSVDAFPLNPHEPFEIRASVGNPIYSNGSSLPSPNSNGKIEMSKLAKECLNDLQNYSIKEVAKEAGKAIFGKNFDCLNSGSQAVVNLISVGKEYFKNNGKPTWVDFGKSAVDAGLDCAEAYVSNELIGLYTLAKVSSALYDQMKIYGKCFCSFNPDCSKGYFEGETITSGDPNIKYGIGYGDASWINNTQELSYGIHFENVDTASASAQIVKVLDTLDATKLDVKTFKLEFLTVGNKNIDISTRTSVNQPILYDMRPSTNLILKIETNLDTITGRLEMLYTSLDPSTMQLTTDPILGFLPPNINKPDGEGALYYSIKLKPNLPNNDVINNTASIYFDTNDPILTPTWTNTIDILSPTSKMKTVVPNTNDTTIYLSWSGTDTQSGVQKYDVMYSENDGAFQSYVTNLANDSIRFHGKAGSSYSFYTLAIDNVGNREIKTNGEVSVKINEQDVQIFPNPSNGEFTVQTKNDIQVTSIQLFDLQGQKIPITYKKINNTFKVQVPPQQNINNYLLKIITTDKSFTRKVTIER